MYSPVKVCVKRSTASVLQGDGRSLARAAEPEAAAACSGRTDSVQHEGGLAEDVDRFAGSQGALCRCRSLWDWGLRDGCSRSAVARADCSHSRCEQPARGTQVLYFRVCLLAELSCSSLAELSFEGKFEHLVTFSLINWKVPSLINSRSVLLCLVARTKILSQNFGFVYFLFHYYLKQFWKTIYQYSIYRKFFPFRSD